MTAAIESTVSNTPETLRAQRRRVPALDVLRGIAIIGTFASNVWLFRAFFGQKILPEWTVPILHRIPDGKFLGLLTIMFGIGLEIQRQAAGRRGVRWPGTYLVRAALLFVDGMLNYIFIVQFDVLRPYAILGFAIAFVLLLPEVWQWAFTGAALALHTTLLLVQISIPDLFRGWEGLMFPIATPNVDGPPTYWDTVAAAAPSVLSDLTLGGDVGTILVMGLSSFMLGALLYRHGIFEARGARIRKWVIVTGLGAGVPAETALIMAGSNGRYHVATVIAFGILALVAQFYQRRDIGFVGRRLATVGRMALSCYVLQNILGRITQKVIGNSPLSGKIDETLGTVLEFAVISVVMILFASVWMRFFRRGPLEWAWDWCFRSITSLRPRSKRVG
jgi:uncharacterized protein